MISIFSQPGLLVISIWKQKNNCFYKKLASDYWIFWVKNSNCTTLMTNKIKICMHIFFL